MFVICLLVTLQSVYASAQNNTTSSQHNQRQGWTASPDGRGTLDIIYQCGTTIALCTWVAIHPRMPPTTFSSLVQLYQKLFLFVIGLVAPEIICMVAAGNFAAARWFRLSSKANGNDITPQQAFYSTSGGIVIKRLGKYIEHDNEFNSYVYMPRINDNSTSAVIDQKIVASIVPSNESIQDRSKADATTKAVTLLQTLWTLLQILARAAQGLPVSILEFTTMAYIVLAGISYACWWHMPYGIASPTPIDVDDIPFNYIFGSNGCPPVSKDNWAFTDPADKSWSEAFDVLIQTPYGAPSTTLPIIITGLSFLLFGGVHCASWTYLFSTLWEQWFWRCSSLFILVFGFLFLINLRPTFSKYEDLLETVTYVLLFPYTFIRLFMIVEAFLAFRDAPSGIYDTVDWSLYLPHVG